MTCSRPTASHRWPNMKGTPLVPDRRTSASAQTDDHMRNTDTHKAAYALPPAGHEPNQARTPRVQSIRREPSSAHGRHTRTGSVINMETQGSRVWAARSSSGRTISTKPLSAEFQAMPPAAMAGSPTHSYNDPRPRRGSRTSPHAREALRSAEEIQWMTPKPLQGSSNAAC